MKSNIRDRRNKYQQRSTPQQPDFPPRPNVQEYYPTQNKPDNQQKQQKPQRQKSKLDSLFGEGIMSDDFLSFVGDASHVVGTLFAILMLFGLLVGGSLIDVMFGSFALGLVFENGVPFGKWMINPDIIAGLVSVVTSGIQIYLILTWRGHNNKLKAWQKIVMWSLIIGDTFLDITAPAYLMTGETALTLNFLDKSMGFYVVLFVAGGACAISENVVVFLSTLRQNGGKK